MKETRFKKDQSKQLLNRLNCALVAARKLIGNGPKKLKGKHGVWEMYCFEILSNVFRFSSLLNESSVILPHAFKFSILPI